MFRVETGSPETMVPVAENVGNYSPQKANRRRFSNPTASTTAASQQRLNEKEVNKVTADTRDSEEEVYGTVHTAPKEKQSPPSNDNSMQVRDPAKEIFGLLRDRESSFHHHRQQPPIYGNVRTHAPEKPEGNSYLDTLQQKLFGRNPNNKDSGESFGTVRYHVDDNNVPQSAFETVRGMMATSNNIPGRTEDGQRAFDVIREKLMNTRQRNNPDFNNNNNINNNNNNNNTKSLRRKNSRKRRRNVSKICFDMFIFLTLIRC